MIGQHYAIKSPTGERAAVGSFVYKSGTDDLIGFIYDSYDDIGEIVLFKPMELPEGVIECKAEFCDDIKMLKDAIGRSCDLVKEMWVLACVNSRE